MPITARKPLRALALPGRLITGARLLIHPTNSEVLFRAVECRQKTRQSMRVTATAGMVAFMFACLPANADDTPKQSMSSEVTAGIVVTEEYNDNIFATRVDQRSDSITVVSPSLNLQLEGPATRFNFGGIAAFGTYAHYTDEDYKDYDLYGNGRYFAAPGLVFSGGGSFSRDREDRSSPDDLGGETPTIVYTTSGYSAALAKFGSTSVNLGGTFDRYDFRDVTAPGTLLGRINNDDRDRDILTAGTRVGYKLNERNEVFATAKYDQRRYMEPIDDGGFSRDSDGARLAGGLRNRGETLDTEIYGGWIYQTYVDHQFDDVSTLDVGGRFAWKPLAGLSIEGDLERRLQEATFEAAPLGSWGVLQTFASLGVYAWARPDLRLNAGLSYYYNVYDGTDRRDQFTEYALGVRKYVAPHLYLGAGYTFIGRDSNIIRESFDQQVAMIRIGRTQDAAYAPTDLDDPNVERPRSAGLYVGMLAGHIAPETKLRGERGGPPPDRGILQADFGDRGFDGGGFIGYGIDVNDWYLGLEGDLTSADAGWDHSRLPGGRVFSVDQKESYAFSAMFGRYLAGGSMLYGRAGAVLQEFKTKYQTSGETFARSDTEFGMRFGIGGSLPVSDHLAFRLEYNYTTFGDYLTGPTRAPDRFANDESSARIGLAYNFVPISGRGTPAYENDFSGFNWGLQVGHGTVASTTTGDRDAGSVLVANFSDSGTTGGIFGGYNFMLGSVLIGGELDAEYSDASWDHERTPTGRSFSVSKQESFGAALRVGYAFNNAVLLYGRLGMANTNFEIEFERGENATTEHERKTGLRYGLGIELPASPRIAMRLDYTFTDYRTLELLTPLHGPPPLTQELETYDTSESLFRVGTVFRY